MFDEIDDTDEDPDYEADSDDEDPASDQEDGRRTAGVAPEVRVYIEPPVERAEGDTDRDSGKKLLKEMGLFLVQGDISSTDVFSSDDSDEPTGEVRHLPRRLLNVRAEAKKRKRSDIGNKTRRLEADESGEEDSGDGMLPGQWSHKNPGLVGTKIPAFVKPVLAAEDREKLESLNSAYDYYRLFQSDSFANEVVYQSRLYAVQKGYNKALEQLSRDTYRYS
jgi:hypothetical protein